MAKARMSFEGILFTGDAGSEATTEVSRRDINYEFDYDSGDTTEREEGDDESPIETSSVTVRKVTITFNKLNKADDSVLASLLAAAYGGTPVAIRTKDFAAGKGFDGDCILKVKDGKPFRGEQTYDFECKPNGDFRKPQLYV
jgi:hypothetical protein